jgi:hypothetical protein
LYEYKRYFHYSTILVGCQGRKGVTCAEKGAKCADFLKKRKKVLKK